MEPKGKFIVKGWTDKAGRSAQSFEELAMIRAKASKSPMWRVKPDSFVPVPIQRYWYTLVIAFEDLVRWIPIQRYWYTLVIAFEDLVRWIRPK